MCKKIGLRVLRGKTRAFQCQVDLNAYAALAQIAKERRVTANTLARLVIELAARTPVFIDQLLDDMAEQRNAADEPIMAAPVKKIAKPVPVSVPEVPVIVCMVAPPMLQGRVY
jgi:hypothetical protein